MRIRTPGRKVLLRAGLGLLLVAVLLQLLPFGRLGPNPPVTRDAPWPNGRARELAVAGQAAFVALVCLMRGFLVGFLTAG